MSRTSSGKLTVGVVPFVICVGNDGQYTYILTICKVGFDALERERLLRARQSSRRLCNERKEG